MLTHLSSVALLDQLVQDSVATLGFDQIGGPQKDCLAVSGIERLPLMKSLPRRGDSQIHIRPVSSDGELEFPLRGRIERGKNPARQARSLLAADDQRWCGGRLHGLNLQPSGVCR